MKGRWGGKENRQVQQPHFQQEERGSEIIQLWKPRLVSWKLVSPNLGVERMLPSTVQALMPIHKEGKGEKVLLLRGKWRALLASTALLFWWPRKRKLSTAGSRADILGSQRWLSLAPSLLRIFAHWKGKVYKVKDAEYEIRGKERNSS